MDYGKEECVWTQEDEDSEYFETDCGHDFCLIDGLPEDNDMKFCCYCGKHLKFEPYKSED